MVADPPHAVDRPTQRSSAASPSPAGSTGRTTWKLRDRELDLTAPRVMGILNLTPDSFSDGGELASVEDALRRAREMVAEGVHILDVGGESTRPGAEEISPSEELRRVLPFIRRASSEFHVPLSVDTRKAEVARAAVQAGAEIVNDVSALTHDPQMAPFLAEARVGVVLMHMRGTPADMRSRASYDDVVETVRREIAARVDTARTAGIEDERVVLDPGIGFAKDADHSLTLVRELRRLVDLGFPVLVGPSRKSFLGAVLDAPPEDRLEGTIASCVLARANGARIFRVHDVREVVRALAVTHSVERGSATPPEPGARATTDVATSRDR